MSDTTQKLFEKQENQLSTQSVEFMKYLVKKGLISDVSIQNEETRKVKQERQRIMYHNTALLLKHYRNIKWVLECFPDTVAEDLETPYQNIDALLGTITTQIAMDNMKLQYRLESLHRSRLLVDRLNEALTLLRKKPGDGDMMYRIIELTYLDPEHLKYYQIIDKLNISGRQYYKLRQQAFSILSIRLWSAPIAEMDSWLEVLTLLEML